MNEDRFDMDIRKFLKVLLAPQIAVVTGRVARSRNRGRPGMAA
jgi:hypothetical protein